MSTKSHDYAVPAGFQVAFKFDGYLADEGMLDGSDYEHTTQATRRLLALHAHAYLHAKVPSSAVSEGKGYQVRHVTSYRGSHVDLWAVYIFPSALMVAGVVGNAYAAEIKSGINAASGFLRDSVQTALGIRSARRPEFQRIEPGFEDRGGNRAPMIDIDREFDDQRLRLRDVTIRVLHDVARPIGRSAQRLTILIEGEPVAIIDEHLKRRWLEAEITEAVHALRENKRGFLA